MQNRKFKITVAVLIALFALISACIFTGKAEKIIGDLIALFGGVILFYIGGNVVSKFSPPDKPQ